MGDIKDTRDAIAKLESELIPAAQEIRSLISALRNKAEALFMPTIEEVDANPKNHKHIKHVTYNSKNPPAEAPKTPETFKFETVAPPKTRIPPQKGKRACPICGRPGHRRKTCPQR